MLKRLLFLFSCTQFMHVCLYAQKTVISREWKFKTGDSLYWASPNYDDSKWNSIKVGLWWAHAGYDYSGIAWYRKTIIIPSSIRSAVESLGYLKLSLGQIQDADQTFLNGKLIGKTGRFSPFEGRWGEARVYFVKADKIRWDAPNTIAVRVYGRNQNGGMHTGPYSFEPYKMTFQDSVTINGYISKRFGDMANGQQKFKVMLHNTNSKAYKGVVSFKIRDTIGTVLASEKKHVLLKMGNTEFSFAYHVTKEGIYYFSSQFTPAHTAGILEKQVIVSTLNNVVLPVSPQPAVIVADKIPDAFVSAPFELQKIGGVLGERMEINLTKRILQVDEQELLDGYLNRPGKQNWIGEHIGKYLETACNAWRYTHNENLKKQMDRMLFMLLHTQLPNGYLGTYTPKNYWTNWDVWSHKYNLIGLLAYYKTTGYIPALSAAKRIGELLSTTFGNNPAQLDLITSGTHVGMASASVLDPIVDLYRYTGDKKYLDFAQYIIQSYDEADGPKIIKTLLEVGSVDKVANGKAYEMLSNLVGIVKMYKITGSQELLNAAEIAWKDIVEKRLYITGAASSFELFRADDVLPDDAQAHMGEGCVTTTWIQFNYQLFTLTGDLKYLEQLERSTYNQLLGAQNPQTGCVSYYTSLQDKKPYSCSITCCLSSVPRGVSMIPLFNYGKRLGVPMLLLFESEKIEDTVTDVTGKIVSFTLQASSQFPDSGHIIYTISTSEKARFPLSIRVPKWADHFTVIADTDAYQRSTDESVILTREWKTGDRFEVKFDIPMRLISGGKVYPNHVAVERGPQVLSVDSSVSKLKHPFIPIGFRFDSNERAIQTNTRLLSPAWIGKQVYTISVPMDHGKRRTISMVPFADASQTGAKAEVWLSIK